MPAIEPTTVSILGDTSGIERSLAELNVSIARLGKRGNNENNDPGGFGSIAKKVIGVTGVIAGAYAAVKGVSKAITDSADAETLQMQFKSILGSTEAATARFKELAKFAADTPFNLPEIAQASKTLETTTKGALSTGAGLTLVGDVAAATGQPFTELAVHIGRMYAGLQGGRPVGEAMNRLNELGIISNDTRAKLEKLQAEGKKGEAVWSVAKEDLLIYSGAMKDLSGTWGGLMSTLSDGITQVFTAFGTPIRDSLKPMLSGGISLVESIVPAAQAAGQVVAEAITGIIAVTQRMVALFQSGELAGLALAALSIGFKEAVNLLASALLTVFRMTAAHFVGLIHTAATPEFWVGLWEAFVGAGEILVGFALKFTAAIVEGGRSFIDPIAGAVVFVKDKLVGAFNLASESLQLGLLRAAESFLNAMRDAPLIGEGAGNAADIAGGAADLAQKGVEDAMKQLGKTWKDTLSGVSKDIDAALPVVKELADGMMELGQADFAKGADKAGGVIGKEYLSRMQEAMLADNSVTVLDATAEREKLQKAFSGVFDKSDEAAKKEADKAKDKTADSSSTAATLLGAVGDSLQSVGGGGRFFGGAGSNDTASQSLSVQKTMSESLKNIEAKIGTTDKLTASVA